MDRFSPSCPACIRILVASRCTNSRENVLIVEAAADFVARAHEIDATLLLSRVALRQRDQIVAHVPRAAHELEEIRARHAQRLATLVAHASNRAIARVRRETCGLATALAGATLADDVLASVGADQAHLHAATLEDEHRVSLLALPEEHLARAKDARLVVGHHVDEAERALRREATPAALGKAPTRRWPFELEVVAREGHHLHIGDGHHRRMPASRS
mmetsp:Transcript_38355/g.89768  ORF Transcript_38355/g.89768 Transcript_38355/m.89768 type:complete len:217 (-) Transcript_38355:425-1075(-)